MEDIADLFPGVLEFVNEEPQIAVHGSRVLRFRETKMDRLVRRGVQYLVPEVVALTTRARARDVCVDIPQLLGLVRDVLATNQGAQLDPEDQTALESIYACLLSVMDRRPRGEKYDISGVSALSILAANPLGRVKGIGLLLVGYFESASGREPIIQAGTLLPLEESQHVYEKEIAEFSQQLSVRRVIDCIQRLLHTPELVAPDTDHVSPSQDAAEMISLLLRKIFQLWQDISSEEFILIIDALIENQAVLSYPSIRRACLDFVLRGNVPDSFTDTVRERLGGLHAILPEIWSKRAFLFEYAQHVCHGVPGLLEKKAHKTCTPELLNALLECDEDCLGFVRIICSATNSRDLHIAFNIPPEKFGLQPESDKHAIIFELIRRNRDFFYQILVPFFWGTSCFAEAALLGYTPYDALPAALQSETEYVASDITIVSDSHLDLCEKAELRFIVAMTQWDGRFIRPLHHGLVAKQYGRSILLCVRRLATRHGIFVPGYLYEMGSDLREHIASEMKDGSADVDGGIPPCTVYLMRECQGNQGQARIQAERILSTARKVIDGSPSVAGRTISNAELTWARQDDDSRQHKEDNCYYYDEAAGIYRPHPHREMSLCG